MNDERLTTPDNVLHIAQHRNGGWAVWLNSEIGDDYSGLCIGCGQTRDEAVSNAVGALEAAVEALQQPPTTTEHQP